MAAIIFAVKWFSLFQFASWMKPPKKRGQHIESLLFQVFAVSSSPYFCCLACVRKNPRLKKRYRFLDVGGSSFFLVLGEYVQLEKIKDPGLLQPGNSSRTRRSVHFSGRAGEVVLDP